MHVCVTANPTLLPTASLLKERLVASLVFLKSWWLLQQSVGGQLWIRRQATCSQLPVCVTLGKSLLSGPWGYFSCTEWVRARTFKCFSFLTIVHTSVFGEKAEAVCPQENQ